MLNNIVGRHNEIARLDAIMADKQAAFLAVYGRRRIGKTFLIREYFKQHIVFDFTGTKDATMAVQLNNFNDEYLRSTKSRKKTPPPNKWHIAFNNLATYIRQCATKQKKVVIFIDEMPWLDTPRSGFVSALDNFWNQHLSKLNNVILVACGSASSWIRKHLINARGGLYNRVTHRMRLQPFTLLETEKYLLHHKIKLTRYQITELYMAFGGVPFYLKYITSGKSTQQLINAICFTKEAPLKDEYWQLYASLFKNSQQHETIIQILAKNPQGLNRQSLLLKGKLTNGTLSRTLDELIECDFIEYYQPFGKIKKDGVYKLIDNFSMFYHKFIYPNKVKTISHWQAICKSQSYISWSGLAFENICMQHILQLLQALGISGIQVSAYAWRALPSEHLPGAQIDILLDRADGVITICEVKFTNKMFIITKDYAQKLRLKTQVFQDKSATKKSVFTSLITPFPAIKNQYYLEQVQDEINLDALFIS
jgi:uncharacterized protein